MDNNILQMIEKINARGETNQEMLKEIKQDLKETKEQAYKTNGRVIKLEDFSDNVKHFIEAQTMKNDKHDTKIDTLEKYLWRFIGAGTVIMLAGGLFTRLYIKSIVNESLVGFEERYNIKYEKNNTD